MGVKVLRELVRSGNLLGEFFNFFFFLIFWLDCDAAPTDLCQGGSVPALILRPHSTGVWEVMVCTALLHLPVGLAPKLSLFPKQVGYGNI